MRSWLTTHVGRRTVDNLALIWLVLACAALVVAFARINNIAVSNHRIAVANHRLAVENQHRIAEIARLRHARVVLAAQADLKICRASNRQSAILGSLVRVVLARGRDGDPRIRARFLEARRALHPVNCRRLPSQKKEPKP